LENPYFILYNRYRGLMRVFLYLTGSFAVPSDYLTDGLTLVSNTSSQMLAYTGNIFVDLTQPHTSFTQIEKAPSDGSRPMAPNKWFMMQYELAYDPQLGTIPYNQMQLSWFTNYNSVSQISLGGNITGTLNGTITASGSTNTVNTALGNLGKVAGTVGLQAVGSSFLNNAAGNYPGSNFTYDANGNVTGTVNNPVSANNNLGLPNDIFTSLKTGLSAGLSAATGNFGGAISSVFSAIFGGSSAPATQTVSLNLNASLTLNGTSTTGGSFPASPTSVWVPGTQGLTTANIANIQGYIPLYQSALGVFSLNNAPVVHVTNMSNLNSGGGKGGTTYINSSSYSLDNSSYTIQFNPAVVNSDPNTGATISNVKKELVLTTSGTISGSATQETVGSTVYWTTTSSNISSYRISPAAGPGPVGQAYLRVSFNITPNNNPAGLAHIIKTFVCQKQ
jgi:hypothetical protein